MYEAFYHLREKPFTLLPDPGFLYLSGKHSMALSMLEYSLMNHAGFTVISGEIGAGKTTLIRHVLNNMQRDQTVGLISTTHRSFGELLQWILLAFNLDHANLSKVEMYQRFVDFIIDEYAHNRSVVLIVDEAQNMPADVLEELRMLSNINADKDQALQVILVGQRELRDILQRPELAQFAQRISVDFHLQALSESETIAYIRHRMEVAGGDPDTFDESACKAVYRFSNGVPRLINVLCDTALVYGYAEQMQIINEELVTDVAREKQQGGIFPTFQARTDNHEPATATNENAAAISDAPGAEINQLGTFPGQHSTADDTYPQNNHTTTAGEALDWQSGQPGKKIRIALCSDQDLMRKYLSRLLENHGIDVVISAPLDQHILAAMDAEKIDVLVIDRDVDTGTYSADFGDFLANWRGPLVYNDTQAMKSALREKNYEFGNSLVRRLRDIAD